MNPPHQYFLVGVFCLSSSLALASEQMMSPSGETGLLTTASANIGPPKQLRLGIATSYSSVAGLFRPDDHVTKWLTRLSIAHTPWTFIELWLNARVVSTENRQTAPELILAQGDLQLGIKGSYPISPLLTIGSDLQLGMRTGIDTGGYDLAATELSLRALLSLDLREWRKFSIPLRVHTNLGIVIDNSRNLVKESQEFTIAERYALDIYDFHRIYIAAGAEWLLGRWIPYIEYALEIPLGYASTRGLSLIGTPSARQDPLATNNQPTRPALGRILPQRVNIGARYRIFHSLNLHFSLELGLTPDQALGVPTIPIYKLNSFVSYNFDFYSPPPKPPKSALALPPRQTGAIVGQVQNEVTKTPLAEVIIEMDAAPPTITSTAGTYRAHHLLPGLRTLRFRKDGYAPQQLEILVKPNKTEHVRVRLAPVAPKSIIDGGVFDPNGQPIVSANMEWTMVSAPSTVAASSVKSVSSGTDGRFTVSVKPGTWRVLISHPDFLHAGQVVMVPKPGGPTVLRWVLHPKNALSQAKIVDNQVILPTPLRYPAGESSINHTMHSSLAALVDLMLSQPNLHVEIAGHTSSRGSPADNLSTSQSRAESVRTYLIQHGISATRITAHGYAGSRPIAPNLIRSGRAKNHRVDITIKE